MGSPPRVGRGTYWLVVGIASGRRGADEKAITMKFYTNSVAALTPYI